MKFKALRTKKEPKEFVSFQTFGDETLMFTGELPTPMPTTATLEGLKEYWKKYSPLPDELSMDNVEMTEFEMIEVDTIGADIRNKLSPCLNLISLIDVYFKEKDEGKKYFLKRTIKKEMTQSKKSIKYLSKLL